MTESKRSSVGDALGAAVADCVRSKERAETERAELFAFLMQVPAAIAVRVGADLTCVFQNEASLAIHDERGQPLLVTWPDIPPGCLAGYDRAFAGETHVAREAEATQVWPAGEANRYWDVTYAPVRRSGGTIEGVMTIALEVTDRVRARQRTEAIEERRRLAFEASGAGTWHMELTTRLVTRDATLNRILGLRAVETLAPVDDYLARLHPDDRASVAEAFEHSIRTGDDYQIEARIIRPDGTTGWVRDVGRVLRGSNARPIAFAGAMVDITAYKHADEQREEASRAKDDFLAMLGHELRNPLAPIVTAVELMKLRGEAASKEREIIERQLQHLNRLVDDLLDISRITRGAIELKRESLVLSDVVAKALEIAAPLFEEKGHHAEIDVPRSLCVVGDPVRLAQVFANLLTNAARYTPRGGHISVAAAHDTDRTIVRVTDDGIGISPEMLDRIFDLFVQGRRGTARSEGGLGIGLALVKNLVRMHGGEVSAHSRGPGTGSEFVVELPDMPGAKVTNRPPPAVPRGQHRRRVLVVDDNIDASELLAELIREIGHDVAVAHDGPQALAMIDHFRPEVAILDIGLPAMDGYELARQIREHGFAHCRMIALTGYGHDRDRARSRDAGFDAHLVKPVDLRMLASVVDAN